MTYDTNNVFAKILRGEIPCQKVAESEHSLAFQDVQPQAAIHILLIPKGAYVSQQDFAARASAEEIVDLWRLVAQIATHQNLVVSGYRTISNHGADAHQEVPHYHLHLLGGEALGPLLSKK